MARQNQVNLAVNPGTAQAGFVLKFLGGVFTPASVLFKNTFQYIILNDGGSYTLINSSTQQTILTSSTDIGILITKFFTDFAGLGGGLYIARGDYNLTTTVNIPSVGSLYSTNRAWNIYYDSVVISGANNTDIFTVGDFVICNFGGYILFDINGSGQAVKVLATTTAQRSLYQSTWDNVMVMSVNNTSTSYAMTLGNILRCNFGNIEVFNTRHGIKFEAQHAGFNPGDSVFNRLFVELNGATNGIAYHFVNTAPSFTCIWNQTQFNIVEAIANASGATFIKMEGQAGFTGPSYNEFNGINAEQFTNLYDIVMGDGNDFNFNYITGLDGTTSNFFKLGAETGGNTFTGKNLVPTSATSDVIINDLSVNDRNPNSIKNVVMGFGGVTRTAYNNNIGTYTIVENVVDRDGPGIYNTHFKESKQVVVFETDFYSTGTAQNDQYVGTAISTGTVAVSVNVSGDHPGVIRCSSSATANSGYRWMTDPASLLLTGSEQFELIFNITTLTNLTGRIGFLDSTTSADAVDGVYIEILATGVATLKTASNSTRTTSATIATLTAGTWYKAVVMTSPTGNIAIGEIFSATGASLGKQANTTNIPTGAGRYTGTGCIFTNSGTVATALVDLDYMRTAFGKDIKVNR
jgi:hypothetical protein